MRVKEIHAAGAPVLVGTRSVRASEELAALLEKENLMPHVLNGRVDRQLYGRCARQGDPGMAESFASAEDELLRRFTSAPVRGALESALARGVPGAQQIAERVISKAQRTAQREAYRQRRRILQSDDWLDSSLSFAGPDGF